MLEIFQEPIDRTTIQLSPHEGEMLRSIIVKTSNMAFNRYVEKMGLQPTNVANYLSGRNRISVAILAKLLAGTNLKLTCLLQVMITNGSDAVNADSTLLDEMLYSPEVDIVPRDDMESPPPMDHPSSLSEKPPKPKTITQGYPTKERLAEYLTSYSPTQPHPSNTPSPTSSDADPPPTDSEET